MTIGLKFMKNKNELKDLLDRLKREVKDSPASGPTWQEKTFSNGFMGAPYAGDMPAADPRAERPERPQVPGRSLSQPPERMRGPDGANLIWSENKETMLFGILASLVAVLGGILAGLDYLILAGTVSFMLFAMITALTLLSYYFNFRRENPEDRSLAERLDHLSRRVEALSVKSLPGQSYSPPGAHAKDWELEQKVEELRTLVKSLAKVVEETGENR
jgi:hypothetical protein